MTSRLALYNLALSNLSTVTLASLDEDVKPRYELDNVYTDVVNECLEGGLWKFAKRTSMLTADAGIEPSFGPAYGFARPEDFVRLIDISTDDRFVNEPPYDYEDGIWYLDVDTIYIKYVSKADTLGWDLGAWPPGFTLFVGRALAERTCLAINRDRTDRNDLLALKSKALNDARRNDAFDEPIQYPPTGRLVRSRFGGRETRIRGNGRMEF